MYHVERLMIRIRELILINQGLYKGSDKSLSEPRFAGYL